MTRSFLIHGCSLFQACGIPYVPTICAVCRMHKIILAFVSTLQKEKKKVQFDILLVVIAKCNYALLTILLLLLITLLKRIHWYAVVSVTSRNKAHEFEYYVYGNMFDNFRKIVGRKIIDNTTRKTGKEIDECFPNNEPIKCR